MFTVFSLIMTLEITFLKNSGFLLTYMAACNPTELNNAQMPQCPSSFLLGLENDIFFLFLLLLLLPCDTWSRAPHWMVPQKIFANCKYKYILPNRCF